MFRSIRSKVMFATAINLLILFLVLMLVAVHSVRHVDQQRDEAVRRKTEEQAEERERLGKAVAGSVAYQVAGLVANWDQAARTTAGQIVQKVKERYKSIVTEVIIAPKGTATFPTEAAVRLQKDVKDMLFAQSGETDTIRFDAASLKYTAAIAPIRDDLDKVTGSVAAIVWRPTYEPAAEGLAAAHFAYIYLLIGFAAVLIFSIIFTEIFLSQGILKPVRALTVAVERAATRGEISGAREGLRGGWGMAPRGRTFRWSVWIVSKERRSEDRGQKTDNRWQMTEDRREKTENRGQRTEGRQRRRGR